MAVLGADGADCRTASHGAGVVTVPPPSGMGWEVGSSWVGQVARIRAMASFSAAVTHRWYLVFTATCRAT